jgi:hypothetical protein
MRYKTSFNGYAVKFSPFIENRIAVATAQNFGIIGNGRQYVLEVGRLPCRVLLQASNQWQALT